MSILHVYVSMLYVYAAFPSYKNILNMDTDKDVGMDKDMVPDIDMDTDMIITDTLVKNLVLQSLNIKNLMLLNLKDASQILIQLDGVLDPSEQISTRD